MEYKADTQYKANLAYEKFWGLDGSNAKTQHQADLAWEKLLIKYKGYDNPIAEMMKTRN